MFLGACSSNLVGLESRRSFDLMMKPCCRLTNLILLDSTRHFALDRFAFSISLSPSSLVSFVFAAKVSSNRDQKEISFRNKSLAKHPNVQTSSPRHLSTFHLSLSLLIHLESGVQSLNPPPLALILPHPPRLLQLHLPTSHLNHSKLLSSDPPHPAKPL